MSVKIAIVGAGNAGCVSALNLLYRKYQDNIPIEIDIYHDPSIPIERVGQGTLPNIKSTIFRMLDLDWKNNNSIKATVKQGINYENWGEKSHDFIHPFFGGQIACHYIPQLLSKSVLESGVFNVIEKNIINPEEEIKADFIMDCRGRSSNLDEYEELTNPLNSVILSRKVGIDPDLLYTRCVATPDGWTFVIPNSDSVSYGYLYNNTVTAFDDAHKNFVDMFDVVPDGHLSFNNYVARNIWRGKRTILNGNRYSFIEPLEATSTYVHMEISEALADLILEGFSFEELNEEIYAKVKEIEKFILWHYQYGSKFDTPFWDHVKTLPFKTDHKFNQMLKLTSGSGVQHIGDIDYGGFSPYSFKNWYTNT